MDEGRMASAVGGTAGGGGTITDRHHHHPQHHSPQVQPQSTVNIPLRLIGVDPSLTPLSRPLPRHPILPRLRITRTTLTLLILCFALFFFTILSYLALPLYTQYQHQHRAPITRRAYHPSPYLSSSPPVVCSHKVFLPTKSSSLLADPFPPAPSPSQPLHAHPPMLPHSLLHFLNNGIACFDVDLFLSKDDILFMGHPTDTATYLTSSLTRPPPPPPPPTLWVETLSASDIERLDPLGYVPRLSTVIATLKAALNDPHPPTLPLSFVNVEPKGRLNTHDGFMILASIFATLPAPLMSTFLLIVDLHRSAAQVQQYYPLVPLVLALRDRNVSRESSAGILCDAEKSREERNAVLVPYKYIWPSNRSIVTCGTSHDGGPDLIQEARMRGKLVGTWVVDDPEVAVQLSRLTDVFISNEPFRIQAALQAAEDVT